MLIAILNQDAHYQLCEGIANKQRTFGRGVLTGVLARVHNVLKDLEFEGFTNSARAAEWEDLKSELCQGAGHQLPMQAGRQGVPSPTAVVMVGLARI